MRRASGGRATQCEHIRLSSKNCTSEKISVNDFKDQGHKSDMSISRSRCVGFIRQLYFHQH